ncbi:MAG TPA: disulfide bond formation protein B [Acetobacteraceae bacterium]|nr:disulfide bond formation protein B [Acetobacteraceae bacterium]
MNRVSYRAVGLAGGALGALALAVALGSERFIDLIPCPLCLRERWPYRVAIVVGVLAALLPARFARAACWLLVTTYVGAASIAFVHVGVEQHWWKSPLPECSAPDLRGLTPAERLARMPDTPSKSCEDPDYLLPGVPVTMTQMNFIYALFVAAGLAVGTRAATRRSA